MQCWRILDQADVNVQLEKIERRTQPKIRIFTLTIKITDHQSMHFLLLLLPYIIDTHSGMVCGHPLCQILNRPRQMSSHPALPEVY